MAIKTVTTTTILDDLDGSPGASTVPFAWDGTSYEIDLTDVHAKEFYEAIAVYVDSARRVRGGRTRTSAALTSSRPSLAQRMGIKPEDVRNWAKKNGIEVNDRGRVPDVLVQQYKDEKDN